MYIRACVHRRRFNNKNSTRHVGVTDEHDLGFVDHLDPVDHLDHQPAVMRCCAGSVFSTDPTQIKYSGSCR